MQLHIFKIIFIATVIGLSPTARADHAVNLTEPEIDSVLPVTGLQSQCIDTPPLNDGFGWNGFCTCSVPGNFEEFGNSLVTDGNKVVIGSSESPNSCTDSGSASIYRIEANGSIVKEGEVTSSIQQSDDAFSKWSSIIALSGNYLAVGVTEDFFHRIDPSVTMFNFDGAVWNEIYVKEMMDNESIEFFGDELFVNDRRSSLTRLKRDDGTLIQTISVECSDSDGLIGEYDLVEDTLAIQLRFCGNDSRGEETLLFRQASSGQYLRTSRFDSGYKLSQMPDGRKLLVAFDNPVTSFIEQDDGTFRELQSLSWPPFRSGYRHNFEIYDGQVFLIQTTDFPDYIDTLRIFDLNSAGQWIEVQELDFHRESRGIIKKMMFSGNRLAIVRSVTNFDSYRVMEATATVFERNDSNRWATLYEKDFTGDFQIDDTISSFAGDNLFLSVAVNDVTNVHTATGDTQNTNENPGSGGIDQCDYTDASLYDGWGWNAATSQSCPPNEVTSAVDNPTQLPQCIDTDGDGFGWNGDATCDPSESTNIVVDNQPSFGQCIDTDGDGFGWDGFATCDPLENTSLPQALQCIDSDGDGFGWNGFATCDPLAR